MRVKVRADKVQVAGVEQCLGGCKIRASQRLSEAFRAPLKSVGCGGY
jgi:hypothetical protein